MTPYQTRVRQLEAEGLTTSDAQAAADAEAHSPTPWRVTEAGYLASNGDGFIEILTPFIHEAHRTKYGAPTPRAQNNAEFIVRACNTHEALAEALSGLLEFCDAHVCYFETLQDDPRVQTANEALRLAREG